MKEFNRINRKSVYKGVILDFCEDEIITPKGKNVKWDFLSHKGAAAVIPIMDDGKILMVKQWRNAIDRFSLEIPAGGKDCVDEPYRNQWALPGGFSKPGESCDETARRELEEETGYKSEHIEFLQRIIPAIAYSGELIDIYVARNLIQTKQSLDPDEDIELEAYSVEELVEMILQNKINDAKTISAILTYYNKFCHK